MIKKSIVDGRWSMVIEGSTVHGRQSTVDGRHSITHSLEKNKSSKLKYPNHRPLTMDYRLFCLSTVVCGLILLLATTISFAQHPTYKPIENLPAFKKQFAIEAKKIQSIKSDFVQEKNLAVLEEKITSEGKFTFKRENKVRIEYIKPFQYLMIMNGDQMLVRDNQKESKVNMKSNKLFQQVNKIMVDCVQGTMFDNKDFTIQVFHNEKLWLIEMTPISKSLKEFFQTVLIYVDKKDYSVSSIDMREPSGDNTMIKFLQKELNVPVQDGIFAVK